LALWQRCRERDRLTITKPVNNTPLYCSQCGATVQSDAKFCYRCGARISRSQVQTPSSSPAPEFGARLNGNATLPAIFYRSPARQGQTPMFVGGIGVLAYSICWFLLFFFSMTDPQSLQYLSQIILAFVAKVLSGVALSALAIIFSNKPYRSIPQEILLTGFGLIAFAQTCVTIWIAFSYCILSGISGPIAGYLVGIGVVLIASELAFILFVALIIFGSFRKTKG